MGKTKQISQDLHKSGSSLGAISLQLKVPQSSVQKMYGNIQFLGLHRDCNFQ
ncbi:hypothetical protein PDJAM_G00031810 [Pangasius djambal]|uniref:Uncharacterized protein n=1 Tax=Pangasius djambal TaxID=1691987 RepID=A0ACC5YT52_9TELE|nr:hypothetical protein [Pangasius djambal]